MVKSGELKPVGWFQNVSVKSHKTRTTSYASAVGGACGALVGVCVYTCFWPLFLAHPPEDARPRRATKAAAAAVLTAVVFVQSVMWMDVAAGQGECGRRSLTPPPSSHSTHSRPHSLVSLQSLDSTRPFHPAPHHPTSCRRIEHV